MPIDLPTFIDFETRSRCKIKLGGRVYSRHPSTQAICAVIKAPNGSLQIWAKGDPPPDIVRGARYCAHNAMGFDRHIWASLGWPEVVWEDTAQYARMAGYSRASLDDLVFKFCGRRKDLEGSKLVRSLSAVHGRNTKAGAIKGRYRIDPIPPEVMDRSIEYCAQDVQDLSDIYPFLAPFAGFEPDVRECDRIINDRGICFDSELAEIVAAASELMAAEAQADAGVDAGLVKSLPKFHAALAELGLVLPNAQKATLEAALDELEDADEPEIVALIEARLGTATIAAGKLRKGLELVTDGRLRDSHKYIGAHPWRWAGQGMQTQNLPK